jgi:hopene-associated glycosyltransferase HpnB
MIGWSTLITAVSALMWIALLLLPWRPWGTAERLSVRSPAGVDDSADGEAGRHVTAIVPARNEREHIVGTLSGLRAQSPALRILVVDDQSTDGTAEMARTVPGVEVIAGEALAPGWTGKLWALHQGIARARTEYVLLVDADIALQPGVLHALLRQSEGPDRALVSVMAALSMRSAWERLLMPAFIYFFKLLYPFALANGSRRYFHAAAGGCMLVRRDALSAIGGVQGLRDAVIDDCTLAARLKRAGYRTWIGLSHQVASTRRYRRLRDTWEMVARTAYSQLRYSRIALLVCTALLLVSFVVPIVATAIGSGVPRWLGALAWLAMLCTYLPVVRFYRVPAAYVLTLPIAATLFLAMTWTSAWRNWRGVRARWKDREYGSVVIR